MTIIKLYFNRFSIYIKNSAWIVFGVILKMIIVIFITSKIGNQIGTASFGWYNLGISVFTVLFSISTLGFGSSFLIKHFVNNKHSTNSIIGTALVSRILCSVTILLLLSIWIWFFGDETQYWVLLIASSCILFQVSDIIKSYYQWHLKANVYVPISSVVLVFTALLLIYGLYNKLGLFYFIGIYAFERALFLLSILYVFNKDIKLKQLVFKYSIFKTLFYQSWPLLFGALLTALYARFDQFLIKFFLTPEDLGIYGAAIILSQVWLILPNLIVPVVFPKIAELKNRNDTKRYYDVIFGLYGVLNYAALFIILFIYFFGGIIVQTLYGFAYNDSIHILKILIINVIILFQSQLTTSVMIVEGEERFLFIIKLISVITNIVLNIIFLSTMGAVFAAYSLIISSFFSWILIAFFNKNMLLLVKLNIKSFLLPLYFKKIIR